MALDNQIYLDARTKGSVARYINHGCDPNCKVDRWKVQGITRAGVFALRDIEIGEELMFDYKWERRRGRAPTKCYCMSANCRGTLELAKKKDLEEEEIEMKLRGYWKKPNFAGEVKEEVVNRVIKIYFKGNQEYFVADVSRYDVNTKLHLVIYKTDTEESWENLNEVEWMILDEEAEHMVIRRREKKKDDIPEPSGSNENVQERSERQFKAVKTAPAKNYVILQNAEREELASKFVIDKCQRYFRVHVNIAPCIRNNSVVNEEEALEEEKALDESKDGLAWKLTIVGLDPWKALSYLQKNAEMIRRNTKVISGTNAATHIVSHENQTGEKYDGIGVISTPLKSVTPTNTNTMEIARVAQEMVIPRQAADAVKKNLFVLRSKCWNVTINFMKSQSRSKLIARLILSAVLPHDLKRAQGVLWAEMLRICEELGLRRSASKEADHFIPKELGFLGGELNNDQWKQFLGCNKKTDRNNLLSLHESMKQNMLDSKILRDFQRTHKCTIWVQPNIDIQNVKNKSKTEDTSRIFIGCHPDRLPEVWRHIVSRIEDLTRGVKFFPLPDDQDFHNLLEEKKQKWSILSKKCKQNNSSNRNCDSLFEFLKNVIGVKVSLDPSTNTYLRIETESDTNVVLEDPRRSNDSETDMKMEIENIAEIPGEITVPTVPLEITTGLQLEAKRDWVFEAENILMAQLQVYRDHNHRKQKWIFGRDWTLLQKTSLPAQQPAFESNQSSNSHLASSQKNSIDDRAISNAIVEICEIVAKLSFHSETSAHAAIILYRYIHICNSNSSELKNEFKLRELLTACIFIANKAQKVTKWKRLDVVLQAAYAVFYSDITLNLDSEEAKRLESRTLAAEKLILDTLQYDVFWSGVDWIIPATSAFISVEVASKVMEIVLSAPLLSIGPSLWLWCGPKYIFASIAGFIRSDYLSAIFPGLELESTKMMKVVDLVVEAVNSIPVNRKEKLGDMAAKFKSLQSKISQNLPIVKSLCAIPHPTANDGDRWLGIISKSNELMFLNKIRNESCFQRLIKGIDLNSIDALENIISKSECSIFSRQVGGNSLKKENVILEGSWRSIAVAEALIEDALLRTNIIEAQEGDNIPSSTMNETVTQEEINEGTTHCVSPPYEGKNTLITVSSPTSSNSSLSTSSSSIPKHHNTSSSSKDENIYAAPTQLCKFEGRIFPGVLHTRDLSTTPEVTPLTGSRSLDAKNLLCGKILEQNMITSGLRWWISPRMSDKGALCDILNVRLRPELRGEQFKNALCELVNQLSSNADIDNNPTSQMKEIRKERNLPYTDISFQRWPAKKVENKEISKQDQKRTMKMGFSAAALQEMQLFYRIHCPIQSPQGHPCFSLPIGIAAPSKREDVNTGKLNDDSNLNNSFFSPIMNQPISMNTNLAKNSLESKLCMESYFLLFERIPITLQKVLAYSKKRRKSKLDNFHISPALFSAWFYDLVSALAYAHMNHVVLRTVHPDQILINEIGESKIGNLTRTIVLPYDEREKTVNPVVSARNAKKQGLDTSNEVCNNPYISPEMLLGSTRYTKESDIWSMGCLMAHLLVNKSLFSGAEGRSKHIMSIFKVVGTPSENNYPHAKRFPHYQRKISKEYKRGVLKALKFHLIDHLQSCNEDVRQEYAGAMDLLDLMLDLDPIKRIKPEDALQHSYMQAFASKRKSQSFRRRYYMDWIDLKQKLLQDDEISTRKNDLSNLNSSARNEKRNKHLMVPSEYLGTDDDDDELYNLDDKILNFRENKGNKRLKTDSMLNV